MRKSYRFIGFLWALFICIKDTHAQYTITSVTTPILVFPDSSCHPITMTIKTNAFAANMEIETSWGDGNTSIAPVVDSGIGYLETSHYYYAPGTYTTKNVLIYNQQRIDSLVYSAYYHFCRMPQLAFYSDNNNNCLYDTLIDNFICIPVTVEVTKNNVKIDTISTLGGFNYNLLGWIGDIYQFKILSLPDGMQLACPNNNVIVDTIATQMSGYTTKLFGITCNPSSNFDLSASTTVKAGIHMAEADILVTNASCDAHSATLVMNFTTKYHFRSASPATPIISGNTYTWNLTGISAKNPVLISAVFDSCCQTIGDTIHSSYYLTPTVGDVNVVNNTIIKCDTIKGGWDPNSKDVTPAGNITAGTELTYTVTFENTGNAPAENIHIMDTLSNNVDPSSIKLISSSHLMNYTFLDDGHQFTQPVLKFDFPSIYLLDSSHHDSCRGMVVFSVKTKSNLPFGTYINNKAGIYFDYNPVVMTNTVTNRIGFPLVASTISNMIKADIYPNPVTDILNITTDAAAYNTLEITNTIGQTKLKQNIKQNDTKVNVKTLPSGIYFINLKGDAGAKTIKFEKL